MSPVVTCSIQYDKKGDRNISVGEKLIAQSKITYFNTDFIRGSKGMAMDINTPEIVDIIRMEYDTNSY